MISRLFWRDSFWFIVSKFSDISAPNFLTLNYRSEFVAVSNLFNKNFDGQNLTKQAKSDTEIANNFFSSKIYNKEVQIGKRICPKTTLNFFNIHKKRHRTSHERPSQYLRPRWNLGWVNKRKVQSKLLHRFKNKNDKDFSNYRQIDLLLTHPERLQNFVEECYSIDFSLLIGSTLRPGNEIC